MTAPLDYSLRWDVLLERNELFGGLSEISTLTLGELRQERNLGSDFRRPRTLASVDMKLGSHCISLYLKFALFDALDVFKDIFVVLTLIRRSLTSAYVAVRVDNLLEHPGVIFYELRHLCLEGWLQASDLLVEFFAPGVYLLLENVKLGLVSVGFFFGFREAGFQLFYDVLGLLPKLQQLLLGQVLCLLLQEVGFGDLYFLAGLSDGGVVAVAF